MSKISGDKSFYHGKTAKTGVLLINLGTPEEPTKKSVRQFLKQFLSDGRVIEIPKAIWMPILYAFILPKRPAASAENYKKVWMHEGSPLMHYSKRQQQLLQREMESRFKGPIHVELAMRYGNPSIDSALEKLQEKGARRILVLPMYPQYSATTTATSLDTIYNFYKKKRWIPELRFINQYHDYQPYIDALAKSVKSQWNKTGQPDLLMMSFHGLPKRNLELGDPYFCHCHKTGRLLADKLGLKEEQWRVTFQSLFGKAEWVKPYTDQTLKSLPEEGIKSVDVICPGFPADCLETLEEINMENRGYFTEAGGEKYNYIPALNDDPDHILALADLIQLHTQGWAETDTNWHANTVEKENQISQQQAKSKGAKI